ncbi:MAG TPA: DUF1932 domain-containing protein [Gammaproteobacteria bacterium]
MSETIAVVATGEMGSAVGAALRRRGHRVVTDLTGRSAQSRALAAQAGIEDLGSLSALVTAADVFLSILPPASAFELARRTADAMRQENARPTFVDCNAVAPATVARIAALFAELGAPFLDAGIVGPAPRADTRRPTRCYVSGAEREKLLALDVPELAFVDLGPDVGRASAMKMCYAALNKGIDALCAAAALAAERHVVRAELIREIGASQPDAAERMTRRVPYLAATAERYAGEMREIAATFAAAGVPSGFHEAAEQLYRALARTPLAAETRLTAPPNRSLDEALTVFLAAFADGKR